MSDKVKNHTNNITEIYEPTNIDWTASTLLNGTGWYSVCYCNGKFVAVGTGDDIAIYGSNGINWTETSLPPINSSSMSAAYGYSAYKKDIYQDFYESYQMR